MSKIMYKGVNYGGTYDNKTIETGSNYIILGNILIQWGEITANAVTPDTRPAEGSANITFSKPYKSAPAIATGEYDFSSVAGEYSSHENLTTSGFKITLGNFRSSCTGTRKDGWLAIGEKA